jgi:uncharacterized RDD family membrane protein YckC
VTLTPSPGTAPLLGAPSAASPIVGTPGTAPILGLRGSAQILGADGPAASAGAARFLTGEAVHLDARVARIGSRMVARLIDLVVQVVFAIALAFALVLILALVASFGVVTLDGGLIATIQTVVMIAAFLAYPVLMETLMRGRTPGKAVLGLRVVRADGGPITFRHALARGLVGLAIEFPGIIAPPITWVITVWAMLASPDGQRIGDHLAGTLVIHERTPAAWGWVPAMPPGLATWAATLDLAGLDDDLALVVRHFLARNRNLREPARTELGRRLAAEVAAVTNPPAPPGTPGWAYLAAVHAERHRRAMHQLAVARTRTAAVWVGPSMGGRPDQGPPTRPVQ